MNKNIEELKMYVWEGDGVLTDHTNGMICVLAYDHSHALRLIQEKCNYCMNSFPVNDYKIITKPEAFVNYGGG